MSSSLWVQSGARRPYERAARKEGRKAEGTTKGGNWTNQFTVFEIRLPGQRDHGLSDVRHVQGCACHGSTYAGQNDRECPVCNAIAKPFYDTDSFLLLGRNKGLMSPPPPSSPLCPSNARMHASSRSGA